MAGLPIYIHAPKFYVDTFGVSLGTLSLALFVLRLIDLVQDPALGWLIEKTPNARKRLVGYTGLVMAAAMIGLFAIEPPILPVLWFGLTLAALFSSFSLLTIAFYAQGVARATQLGANGHTRLAAWREGGALLGISLATLAPVALASFGPPFTFYAIIFAGLTVLSLWAMSGTWQAKTLHPSTPLPVLWGDPMIRRLLIIAFLNATPVAITSTLFLFFVESRLGAPGREGPLLLLFFVSAAIAAPFWAQLARLWSARWALVSAMTLAIASFVLTLSLSTGDMLMFALICLFTGAATGADLTLLPALFAGRLAKVAPSAGQAFGIWAFVNKFALAFAAIALFPILEYQGFVSGTDNTDTALWTLSLLYAGIPCALKIIALALLAATPLEET